MSFIHDWSRVCQASRWGVVPHRSQLGKRLCYFLWFEKPSVCTQRLFDEWRAQPRHQVGSCGSWPLRKLLPPPETYLALMVLVLHTACYCIPKRMPQGPECPEWGLHNSIILSNYTSASFKRLPAQLNNQSKWILAFILRLSIDYCSVPSIVNDGMLDSPEVRLCSSCDKWKTGWEQIWWKPFRSKWSKYWLGLRQTATYHIESILYLFVTLGRK